MKVVDYFIHKEFKKISDSYVIKAGVLNTKAYIDTSGPELKIPKFSENEGEFLPSVLLNNEDPYFTVDILMTKWVDRRKEEYNQFFIDFKKLVDAVENKNSYIRQNIKSEFDKYKIKVGKMITSEHGDISRLIDVANLYIWE